MSASKHGIKSDLAKADAYQNTDADFARATLNKRGVPVRGRPSLGDKAKKQVTLRLDPAVLAHFRAMGDGWQGRMNGWLAVRQDVVDLIVTYDASADAMRHLLVQLKDQGDGFRALVPDRAKSIESVERQIALTESAAAGVRRVLSEQALLHAPIEAMAQ